jgi:hypothetical protein
MANRVPFTMHIRVLPNTTGLQSSTTATKRVEISRLFEKTAYNVQRLLEKNLTSVNVADGGGSANLSVATDGTLLGDAPACLTKVAAVVGSFGDGLPVVTVTGFYNVTPTAPYPSTGLVHAGKYTTGPETGARGGRSDLDPPTAFLNQFKAFKLAVETALTSISSSIDIVRVDYCGVTFGMGGHHFPR